MGERVLPSMTKWEDCWTSFSLMSKGKKECQRSRKRDLVGQGGQAKPLHEIL